MTEKKEAAQGLHAANLRAGSASEPRADKTKKKTKAAEKKELEAKAAEVKEKAAEVQKKAEKAGESLSKSLVDQVREGMATEKEEKPSQSAPQKAEFIAVIHVHASKNNTIVTATDISGAETFARMAGGMVVKTGREERSPFAAGQMARKIADVLKERGVTKVDVLIRGKGGHRGQKTPGRAASAVIKILARTGIRIRRIEDVTPIPHGGSKPPGGKRGRRV
jgi:small subunit ribosomal protein S11